MGDASHALLLLPAASFSPRSHASPPLPSPPLPSPALPSPAGIDLSPILAFIVLDLFTNTAAALPAEVDEQGQLRKPAAAKNAWQRRMAASAERRRLQRQQQQQQRQ